MIRRMFFFLLLFIAMQPVSFAIEPTSGTWSWRPSWRDHADCGPNALYVLMNLEGHSVKLEDVKKQVPLAPVKGCSMETLIEAAEKLGFSLEARFVKPGDVSKMSRPFILHGVTSHEKDLGHFVVVVDFDSNKRNFALIDPIRETFGWNPETSVLYDFSGYVLVPKYPVSRRWDFLAGVSLICCGLGCFLLVYRTRCGCRRPKDTSVAKSRTIETATT